MNDSVRQGRFSCCSLSFLILKIRELYLTLKVDAKVSFQKIQIVKMGVVLLIVNVIAFALFGLDKFKAHRGQWRIPEAVLLASAVIGGSIGAIAGMFVFRHKTRKDIFRYGLFCVLFIQLIVIIVI